MPSQEFPFKRISNIDVIVIIKIIITFETVKLDIIFGKMKYFIPIYIVCLFLSLSVEAQSIEDARKLYSEKNYAEALPLFESIVKSTSKKIAAQKSEAYQSLGHIYYLLYEFEKSAEAYSKYADGLTKEQKSAEAAEITPLIERSERAARMLSHCEDIQLIDSVIMDKTNFLNAYFLSGESGYLENREGKVIYENPLRDKRYFAGKKEGQGKRLYSEIKLQTDWMDRTALHIPSDSLADDDYPFVLPDGLTMYYASTGKTSIGGYDLYITRYNMNNDSWLAPGQMGMPFNSIANDYLMAIDEINRIGYFATDRFQPEGKVIIYTFIPNEETLTLEIDNEQERINRAKIVSIQDTWKSQMNYKAYLKNVRNVIRQEQEKPVPDFVFVLTDNVVYHTLSDFRNDAAKQAFIKSETLKKSIEQLQEELDVLRLEYIHSGSAQRQKLSSSILSKETLLENLMQQQEQLAKNVRNFELKK
jgi:hypothetical protein